MALDTTGQGVRKRARLEGADLSIDSVLDPSLEQSSFSHPLNQDPSQPSPPSAARTTAGSAFRNVSACNRCRHRKNRCVRVSYNIFPPRIANLTETGPNMHLRYRINSFLLAPLALKPTSNVLASIL